MVVEAENRLVWAERRWRGAVWVHGVGGNFASVSYCPRGITVVVCETREGAEAQKRSIDEGGCGGRCVKEHEVVQKWGRSQFHPQTGARQGWR